LKMVEEAKSVSFIQTDSVLEALILEANEIKKHLPEYNTKEKDNTSFNYVVLTKEQFPRVLVVRGRNLGVEENEYSKVYGPFPHGFELREALRIIRKIFPYRDKCQIGSKRPCFNAQIGLCPGVCAGLCTEKEYAIILRHLKLFFEGKKKQLIKLLEQEMKYLAKSREFEKAGETKKTIFALNHIQDVALMKRNQSTAKLRIEAYDVAHLSGKDTVGVMVVVEDGEKKVTDYRKFKIRGTNGRVNVDDTANLAEILDRRLNHPEWSIPNLIVIDGSVAQVNSAKKVLVERGANIEIVSVVKDEKHRPRGFLGSKTTINEHKHEILLANNEAHRFAITYHRKLRGKQFKI
jgi:excinuclease ABC subunit C